MFPDLADTAAATLAPAARAAARHHGGCALDRLAAHFLPHQQVHGGVPGAGRALCGGLPDVVTARLAAPAADGLAGPPLLPTPQNIVDSYGIARYREVNPAVLTLMTFPFLFAVMFGDWGHATLMIAFALLLVVKERALAKQDLGDMLSLLFGGRYVILLMGIFSFYMGFIYNEFFSMPTTIFGRTRVSRCALPCSRGGRCGCGQQPF